jgi:hypothetical protein
LAVAENKVKKKKSRQKIRYTRFLSAGPFSSSGDKDDVYSNVKHSMI